MTLTGQISSSAPEYNHPPDNPIELLNMWLDRAKKANVVEPYGFVLSTVDELVRPSSRVVLMKELSSEGIIFTSQSKSKKGTDIAKNSSVAGNFWWRETIQQICFTGTVTILPQEVSDKFFCQRPRIAQAVSALSQQSLILTNETELKSQVLRLNNSSENIERPNNWHAYLIEITMIEFWAGNQERLHRRLKYTKDKDKWGNVRLNP